MPVISRQARIAFGIPGATTMQTERAAPTEPKTRPASRARHAVAPAAARLSQFDRLADGAWLEPRLIAFVTGFLLIAWMVVFILLFATARGTLDAFGRPLGTDFAAFYSAGRMALEGQAPLTYDWPAHLAAERMLHGVDVLSPWSYPPIFLMVTAALATLPYVASLLVWSGATLAFAAAMLWRIMPGIRVMLIGLACPAVLVCLGHGQTGFLTAGLLVAGALALPRHEIVAGVAFGLLAYKPQFAILIPVALLAGGHWRAIGAAALTVAALVGISLALWGVPVWEAFFNSLHASRTIVLEQGSTGFEKFQSAFAWWRLWGARLPLAYAAQAIVTVASVGATFLVWRSDADARLKAAVLLLAALLSSPYVLDYDFVVLGMAVACLVAHALQHGFARWEKTLLALAWLCPLFARTVAGTTLLPVGFFILLAVFALAVQRALAGAAARAETPARAESLAPGHSLTATP